MSKRLLIVDDDDMFCQTVTRSLTRRSIAARAVHSLAELFEVCESGQCFDYIVLDLNLGAEHGLDALPTLRKHWPTARILVLTGFASIPTTVQAIKLGADNYLAKPANTTSILQALEAPPTVEPNTMPQLVAEPTDHTYQPMSVRRLEWEHIQQVLAAHQGNISAAARALNMHRRTLQRKLAKRPVSK